MSDSTICFVILAVTVGVFIWDRFPVALVAVGVSVSLWATDILDLNQALAGFGDPAVIFIAALFVVSAGLDSTGVTAWAGQQLIANAGESRTRLLVYTMLLVAGLTALISVNGAVAALVPVVVVMAVRLGQLALPAPDAARLRCARGLAAGADRHARQRGRLGGLRRGGRGQPSASSTSRSSASRS